MKVMSFAHPVLRKKFFIEPDVTVTVNGNVSILKVVPHWVFTGQDYDDHLVYDIRPFLFCSHID